MGIKKVEINYDSIQKVINVEFSRFNTESWKNIIKFNQKIRNEGESLKNDQIDDIEMVKVSWFPTKIDVLSVNKLNSIFSKVLLGNNGNTLEIMIDKEKNVILNTLLIKSDEKGNVQEIIEKPITDKLQDFSKILNLELFFDDVKKEILSNHYIDIGYIKIIDESLLKEINGLESEISEESNSNFLEWVENRLIFLKKILYNISIQIYPEPPVQKLLKNIKNSFEISFGIRSFLKKCLELGNVSITLKDTDWYITLILENDEKKHNFKINYRPIFEFGQIGDDSNKSWEILLNKMASSYSKNWNVKRNYLFDIEWIAELLDDIIESEFPITENRMKFLLQKFLLGLKKIGDSWDVSPRSSTYHEGMRFFLRTFGYHINPRKLSYWSIPDSLSLFLKKVFGIDFKLLMLIGNNDFSSREVIQDIPKGLYDVKPLIFEVVNSKLLAVTDINKDDIVDAIKPHSSANNENQSTEELESIKFENKVKIVESNFKSALQEIFRKMSEKYGIFRSIIFLDENLLINLIQFLTIGIHSRNPLSFLKIIKFARDFKNSMKFWCYPDLPQFQYFRKTNTIKLIKQLNSILYDYKEF